MIIAAKLVCLVIWIGAATSKLNKHFPFVISTMMSNNPVFRPQVDQAQVLRALPRRPAARAGCRGGSRTSAPRSRGWCRWCCSSATAAGHRDRRIRHGVLPLRHPVGDPDGGAAGVERLHDVLRARTVRRPRRSGPGRPAQPVADRAVRRASPAPSWWETCSRARSRSCPACGTTRATGTPRCGASSRRRTQKIAAGIVAIASMPAAQMEKFYGSRETAEMYQYMGYAFRSLQHPRPGDVHAGAPCDGRGERG